MRLSDLVRKYVGIDETSDPSRGSDQVDDEREAFEERAAIMEHDGGLSRESAERAAQSTMNLDHMEFGSILEDAEVSEQSNAQIDFPFGANIKNDEETE